MAKSTSKRKAKAPKVKSRKAKSPKVKLPKARAPGDKAAVLGAALTLATAIRRGKTETVERLLARDFTFIDASGKTHSRRDVLRNLKAGPASADTREKVRTYGAVALITGALKSAQAKERHDLFALDVWVKGEDGWQALIHHDNVLAPKNASKAAPAVHAASHPRPPDAPPPECKNPLQVVPYEPKSQAERDVIAAF